MHGWLDRLLLGFALASALAGCGRDGSAERARAVDHHSAEGWYEVARQPGGASREEIMSRLDALGYVDTYEAAGGEFGVTAYDRERVQPGQNLIVSAHAPCALLTDMRGEVLHEWRYDFAELPKPADYTPPRSDFGARYFRRVHLFDDGSILALFERTGLVKIDRESKLVWGLVGEFHHDLDVAADGTIFVLTRETRLIPRFHATRGTVEDFVTRLSPEGELLGRQSLLEAFERSPWNPLVDHAPDREDVFHTNTLTLLGGPLGDASPLLPRWGPGHALISVWGLDAVAVLDLEANEIEWALAGLWRRQHEPVFTPAGTLLVFDNQGLGDFARVVEVDPMTQERVWSFDGDAANDFRSPVLGSVQRLANGNTLITESTAGRAFEVTAGGDVVWSWSSPYRAGPGGEGVAVLVEVARIGGGFSQGLGQ